MWKRNQRRRQAGRVLKRILLLQVGLCIEAYGAGAEIEDASWQVQPELYVAGISGFQRSDGKSSGYDTFAVTAELTFFSRNRPFWGGPFVDYRTSSASRHEDNLNVGVYGRYNLMRWDLTGWLFENRSPGNAGAWIYATRFRYRIADSVKLGFETLAPLENAGRPRLMLGYYGAPSDALSLNVLAGGGSSGSPDFTARVELVWKVH